MMHAGRLRDIVVIETPTRSVATDGQPKIAWSTHRRAYADVTTQSMKERVAHGRVEAGTTWRVTIRYDAGFNETMRIRHGSRTLNVTGFAYDKHRRFIICDCAEAR